MRLALADLLARPALGTLCGSALASISLPNVMQWNTD